MRATFAKDHQDNYIDAEEAEIAAWVARSYFALEETLESLARGYDRFPDTAWPFSGDHLGTHSRREKTTDDEVRRERIHTSDISLWGMVAA